MEPGKKMNYNKLSYGEVYVSTKPHIYSNYDDPTWSEISVPEKSSLLFRSFQEYGEESKDSLALFYWLEKRTTLCLVVSEETPILYLQTREDKTKEIK